MYYSNLIRALLDNNKYEFDRYLAIIDILAGHRFILKLKENEINILISWDDKAIYREHGKLYYKGHEIERIN